MWCGFARNMFFVIRWFSLVKTLSFTEDVLTSCDLICQVSRGQHSLKFSWKQCGVTEGGTDHLFLKNVYKVFCN